MAGRKTIMVDESVWKKVEFFKHRNCMNSIGEALDIGISSLVSKKYFAGIHHDKMHNYRVEAVGKTELETARNLIDNAESAFDIFIELEDIKSEAEVNEKIESYFIVECTKTLYYEYLRYIQQSKYFACLVCPCHLIGEKGRRIADTETSAEGTDQIKLYALLNLEKKQVENVGNSAIQIYAAYQTTYCESTDNLLNTPLEEHPENFKIMKCTPEFASEFIRFTQPLGPLETRVIHRITSEFGEDIIDTTPNDKYYAVVSFDSEEEMKPVIREIGRTATEAKSNFIKRLPRYLEGLCDAWGPNKWEANENQTEWKNDTNGYYDDLIIMECSKQLYAGVLSSEWYEKCKSGYSDDDEIDEDLKPITCEIEEIDGVRRVI